MEQKDIVEFAKQNKAAEIKRLKTLGISDEQIEGRLSNMDFISGARETLARAEALEGVEEAPQKKAKGKKGKKGKK